MVSSSDSNMQTPPVEAYNMDRLSAAFEASAKRWELIVYPSLFFFILLCGYGFYLIFNLAKDVHYLSVSVDSNMNVMSSNMQSMADSVSDLSVNMRTMVVSVENISQKVGTLEPILTNMNSMDESMKALSVSTDYMQHDMSSMNNNISRPMDMMNRFIPW